MFASLFYLNTEYPTVNVLKTINKPPTQLIHGMSQDTEKPKDQTWRRHGTDWERSSGSFIAFKLLVKNLSTLEYGNLEL